MLEILQDLFTGNKFFNDEGAPLKACLTPGDTASKVAIVTGTNCSGKSFAIRVLATWLGQERPKVEALQVSMRYRTEAGMHRCFMFGPFGDAQDSTGAVSVRAIEGAMRTARGRETPCWVMLDEPDTGLSEEFTHALGEHLAHLANEGLGDQCGGLVVVTHSKELVRGMVDTLLARPHFAHIDAEPLTAQQWLATSRRRSIEELLGLTQRSVETFRALNKLLKD